MTEDQIKHMVDRFLSWRLPENFAPDCGIHFDADAAKKLNPINARYEPVGTNLLDATQATAMVKHMVDGLALTEEASLPSRALPEDVALLLEKMRGWVKFAKPNWSFPLDYDAVDRLTLALLPAQGEAKTPGKGRASVGSGGDWRIADHSTQPGSDNPRHVRWLPKGYGPCQGQFTLALVARPFDNYELDKQLARAIADAAQEFIWAASRRHRPVKERGWQPLPPPPNPEVAG